MSWTTDVLLLLSLDEVWVETEEDDEIVLEEVPSEALANINTWLQQNRYGELISLAENASKASGRAMLTLIYGGAFNYLDEENFIDVVKKQKWRSPQNLLLLLKGEGEENFTIHRFI